MIFLPGEKAAQGQNSTVPRLCIGTVQPEQQVAIDAGQSTDRFSKGWNINLTLAIGRKNGCVGKNDDKSVAKLHQQETNPDYLVGRSPALRGTMINEQCKMKNILVRFLWQVPRILNKSAKLVIVFILVHLLLILKAGYFLSPELSLYPFLTKNGFLPYRDLIDQHFPAILFGPISLPFSLCSNPFPLLLVFLIIIILTDLLIFSSLKRSNSKHPQLITFLFILITLYFGGNYFWLETFICFFLSIIIFLSFTRSDIVKIALGFFVSLIFLIKPTLFPGLVVLLFLLKLKPNRYLLVGLFLPIVLTFLYLFKLNLFTDFYDLTINFNRHYYLFLATKVPTTRNIVALIAIVFPLCLLHFPKDKFVIVTAIFFSLLAFPRFEPFHLLPSLLILIYFASRNHYRFQKNILIGLLLILIVVNFLKIFRYNYGNFYLNPETVKAANYFRQLPGNTLYLLGGNDLLYPLSNKIPPSFTYVPSLPWYLSVDKYQDKLIQALIQSPITPIAINSGALLDNIAIVNEDTSLMKHIKKYYLQIDQVGPYQIYEHRLFAEEKKSK